MKTNLALHAARLGWAAALAGVAQPGLAQMEAVPFGAAWRYFAQGRLPAQEWFLPGYADTNWPLGKAKLGFGGDGEATVIGSPTNGYRTFYFRKTFALPDPTVLEFWVGYLLVDDGALVRINGQEVFRHNLPPGAVGYGTLAPLPRNPPEELTAVRFHIPPTVLLPGGNVVAVEVHQNHPGSEDLGFDLAIRFEPWGQPPEILVHPASQVAPFYTNVAFVVVASGEVFQYQWLRDFQPIPGAVEAALLLTNVTPHDVALYRVQVFSEMGTGLVSGPAELQAEQTLAGPILRGVVAADDPESLFRLENRSRGPRGDPPAPTVFLSRGVPLFFTVNEANPEPGLVICGVPSTHTKWVGYYSPGADRLRVTTDGSSFNTVLGVYTNNNGALGLVGCDAGPPVGNGATVEFDATKRLYYLAVDGEGGATGTARLEIRSQFVQQVHYNPTNAVFSLEVVLRPGSNYTIWGTNIITTNLSQWRQWRTVTTNVEAVLPFAVTNAGSNYFIGVKRQ